MDDEGFWDLTDAFAEILLRLPPACRRRFRLVCRHWRAVIDERAPVPRPSEPKPLVYVSGTATAYVIDDLRAGGRRFREVWRCVPRVAGDRRRCSFDTQLVGTCNGLLCLCDNTSRGGAVSLVNPATGESLALPPLPGSDDPWARTGWGRWHQTYGFVHGPATGRYTVVHLPCDNYRAGKLDAVRMFTLGDAAAAGATSCRLDAGIVGVGGAAYWVTEGNERVMAFDAERERVAPAAPLPVAVVGNSRFPCRARNSSFHLTEVRGRLGFVVTVDEPTLSRTEVWVLGGGREGARAWSCRYKVQVHGAPRATRQELARPHFGFTRGEFVLTNGRKDWENAVFAHRLPGAGKLQCGEVRINERKPGTAVARLPNAYDIRTFAYVETTEPLSVYRL
ncbi:unnamed protein product [Urochloa decumbens]|uniref:F-box domain-containing protein n=1 Tax=Urochloa decumbens TaxID=240449 RepID=A0ABC9BVS7_9POAL